MGIQQNVARMMNAFKEQRNKSTAEFSEELEISRSTLQEYLNGTGNPSVLMLDHLAQKLEVDPMVLVSGTFQREPVSEVLLLFRMTKSVMDLPQEKRNNFASLFLQMAALWEDV